jgi:hypothetical protein
MKTNKTKTVIARPSAEGRGNPYKKFKPMIEIATGSRLPKYLTGEMVALAMTL